MEKFLLDELQRKFLQALVDNDVKFLIIGLTSASIQGAPVITEDIDLWFENLGSEKFIKAVKDAGAFYVPPLINNPPMFGPSTIGIFDPVVSVKGLEDFNTEYKNSKTVELDGLILRFLPLERVIESKRALGRPKDLAALPVLQATLDIISRKKQ